MSTFYERWAALPRGTKFRTTYPPGKVFMKTSRAKGVKAVCLTDGSPVRLPNIVNPLGGFDRVITVIDFKAIADDIETSDGLDAASEILRCL